MRINGKFLTIVLALATGCGSSGGSGSSASQSTTPAATTSAPSSTQQPAQPASSSQPSTPAPVPINTQPLPGTAPAPAPAPAPASSSTPPSGSSTTPAVDPHVLFALNVLNTSRAQYGALPLQLDTAMTTCALRHATDVFGCAGGDIAQFSGCAHQDFRNGDTCNANGENQGVASGSDQDQDFLAIHQSMMAEGPPPPGQVNHFSNIVNPNYTTVGIGLYFDSNDILWVSEEFK